MGKTSIANMEVVISIPECSMEVMEVTQVTEVMEVMGDP